MSIKPQNRHGIERIDWLAEPVPLTAGLAVAPGGFPTRILGRDPAVVPVWPGWIVPYLERKQVA
jgi:hypothetical protein